jgi:hypothetical protein
MNTLSTFQYRPGNPKFHLTTFQDKSLNLPKSSQTYEPTTTSKIGIYYTEISTKHNKYNITKVCLYWIYNNK